MRIMLLTEHHLEFLSLKRGCTGSSQSKLVKMTHCLKSHVAAQIKILMVSNRNFRSRVQSRRIILFPYTQSNDNLLKHLSHCLKSHVAAQIKILMVSNRNFRSRVQARMIILFPYTQSNDNLLKHLSLS